MMDFTQAVIVVVRAFHSTRDKVVVPLDSARRDPTAGKGHLFDPIEPELGAELAAVVAASDRNHQSTTRRQACDSIGFGSYSRWMTTR